MDAYYKCLQDIVDDYKTRINELPLLVSGGKINGRKHGGILRSFTGKLTEDITENLVKAALIHRVGLHPSRVRIDKTKIRIPMCQNYFPLEASESFKKSLANQSNKMYFSASVDKHVWIDNELRCGIECKTYTENAMLKRILVDFQLLRSINPNMVPFLFQLENFLGGDYGSCQWPCNGSESTHTLMSYFPEVPLRIVTLLEGDRSVQTPFYEQNKPLLIERLDRAASRLLDGLGMGTYDTNGKPVIEPKENTLEGLFQ